MQPSSLSWREQVEHGIADHYAHGKTPRCEPKTDADWVALEERFPTSPLRAIWFTITGRELGGAS